MKDNNPISAVKCRRRGLSILFYYFYVYPQLVWFGFGRVRSLQYLQLVRFGIRILDATEQPVVCDLFFFFSAILDDNFDEFSAETLAAIDNELQQIKLALLQRFPQLDLSSVHPIGQVLQRIMTQTNVRQVLKNDKI